MKCSVQNTLEMNLPDDLKETVNPFNTEWNEDNGQAWETKNFIELTKDKKVLLDIGAHIGFFSFLFVINNNVNSSKKVYSFEPSPWSIKVFVDIKEYNKDDERFEKIHIYDMFVGEEVGENQFLVEEGALTCAMLYERDDPLYRMIPPPQQEENKIKTTTVDVFSHWLQETESIIGDVMKIDVEGFDCRVLQGSLCSIKETGPLIFLEIHSKLLKMYNNTIMNVYEIITKELGYNFYDNKVEKIKTKNQYLNLFSDKSEIRLICSPSDRDDL